MVTYTILVPVYNEELIIKDNMQKLLSYLRSLGISFEVLVVSNGSTDKTADICKVMESENKEFRFFDIGRKGVGLAFKLCLEKARGDYIISVDADLSIELDFIRRAVSLSDDHDIVVGSKKMGKQKRSFLRKVPSTVFIYLTRLLICLRYKDYSMAAKMYRKDLVLQFKDYYDAGSSYVIEAIFFAKKKGARIIEVPVMCDDNRKSRFNIAYEAWYRFWRLLKLFFFRFS